MPFYDPTPLASKLLVLTGLFSCDAAIAPDVQVVFDNQPPVVSTALDHQALGGFKTSSRFSHSPNETFVTGGLTESNISSSLDLNFNHITNTLTDKSCLTLTQATVHIIYAPKVYVASNYAPNTCNYKATWLHELKHVNTDILTIKEFMPVVKAAAQAAVPATVTPEPIPSAALETRQKEVGDGMSLAIEAAVKRMDTSRTQRQQLVDTRAEYLYLSELCRGKK
jgi:hypothetical protein